LDFTSNPTEAIAAKLAARNFMFSQANLNYNGHAWGLKMKFHFADRIVPIARHVEEFLIGQGAPAEKLVTIPNGIDLHEVDRDARNVFVPPQNTVLVVGQIEARKRHQDIIQAMPKLIQRHPEIRLAIAGNVYQPEYLAELQRITGKLGLADRVDFLGGRTDILPLMKQARAFVRCSESEGLPWAILEAMTARLPIVASDIEAHRELIQHGHTGLLSSLGQPTGYADALDLLLSSPKLSARLASEARTVAEQKFSAEVMVRKTERIYREIMRLHNSPKNAS
jgi:glycosyltransferase involved in cell wall biosynthesis